jgi:membrane-associated HD superfamily phosphohydrolase
VEECCSNLGKKHNLSEIVIENIKAAVNSVINSLVDLNKISNTNKSDDNKVLQKISLSPNRVVGKEKEKNYKKTLVQNIENIWIDHKTLPESVKKVFAF